MPTLVLSPAFNLTERREPRVLRQVFGDGYEERARDGINTIRSIWSVQAEGLTDTQKTNLASQLDSWAGVTSFNWDPYGNATTRKYVCDTWSFVTAGPNAHSFAGEFREVF